MSFTLWGAVVLMVLLLLVIVMHFAALVREAGLRQKVCEALGVVNARIEIAGGVYGVRETSEFQAWARVQKLLFEALREEVR